MNMPPPVFYIPQSLAKDMKRLTAIAVLVAVVVAGCARGLTEDEFVRRDHNLEAVYYTGTKEEADASLRKQLVLISEAEAAGLKAFDYDKIRFYTHVQLSRLANARGKEEQAQREMNLAISYFRRVPSPDAKKTDAELVRGFTALADAVEKEKLPAWRKEPTTPSGRGSP